MFWLWFWYDRTFHSTDLVLMNKVFKKKPFLFQLTGTKILVPFLILLSIFFNPPKRDRTKKATATEKSYWCPYPNFVYLLYFSWCSMSEKFPINKYWTDPWCLPGFLQMKASEAERMETQSSEEIYQVNMYTLEEE